MIVIKSKKEIEIMRQAGLVVADTLERLAGLVKPGITTAALDRFAEDYLARQGAKPSLRDTMVFRHQFVLRLTGRSCTGYQVSAAWKKGT